MAEKKEPYNYYAEQLQRLQGDPNFLTVKFYSEKGETKCLQLNEESIPAISNFLIHVLIALIKRHYQ